MDYMDYMDYMDRYGLMIAAESDIAALHKIKFAETGGKIFVHIVHLVHIVHSRHLHDSPRMRHTIPTHKT